MSGKEDLSKVRRFWRALASGETESPKPVNLTRDLSHLSDNQREERKHALKTMLAANEARQQDAQRGRRPSMALGQRVLIISGSLEGLEGRVLDADFIRNKVQLDVDDMPDPQWLSFRRIGSL